MTEFRVVIAGGGLAGVEGLLRLRRLAGDAVSVTVIAPNDEVVYRPLTVGEPFAMGRAKRFALAPIAAQSDAELIAEPLTRVDLQNRVAHTASGTEVPYDALLIAAGARSTPAFRHVSTFSDRDAEATYLGIVRDIEQGYLRSLALIIPEGPAWPLPIYELALMTAERARAMGMADLEISLITPEAAPLAAFGAAAREPVQKMLEESGVTLYTSATAQVPDSGHIIVQPGAVELSPRSIVALPRLSGPVIRGVPTGDAQGFIPIDKHCAVPGTDGRVFAAGDAAAFPIKHGGLGSQQADTAAANIARLAGAAIPEAVFNPVISGMLLTGSKPLYVRARVLGGRGFESETFTDPPWPADDKVVAEELGSYLHALAEV
jgi:sulfide:quinone oxidoreductase